MGVIKQGYSHFKVEFFKEGSATCDFSYVECRFDLEKHYNRAKAYMAKHYLCKDCEKALIFVDVPYEDVDKELVGLYTPKVVVYNRL